MTASGPLVRIFQGQLRGVIEKSITGIEYAAFKGIPYAKPPVGELRFKDPVPAESWSHILDASKFGGNCAQLDPMTHQLIGSEDCLYLNVYTPLEKGTIPSSPKPVMVWIHGGAFAYGSGDDTIYGPDYIVEKDVILVTLNYRLGILGFLNLEDEEITGNQGLKDQVLALKWVNENIANFRGDSKNITIFGESAGGASVHYLALSPSTKGLYQKAISQSGSILNPWASVAESAKGYAQKLAAALGKKTDDSKELLEFFKGIDARKLVGVDSKLCAEATLQGLPHFVPSVDAKSKNPFLPQPVNTIAQLGVNVPYLIGHTSHEGIIFLAGLNDKKWSIIDADFEKALTPGIKGILQDKGLTTEEIREMYFGYKPVSKDAMLNYMQMQSDLQFVCGIHEIAAIQVAKSKQPTYLYNFSYDSGNSMIKANFGIDVPGTSHADDLGYILYPKIMQQLGVPHPERGTTQRLVIERFVELWTNFAKTGNPTPTISDTLPVIWKPLKNGEFLDCLNISENLEMEVVKNVNKQFVKKSKSNL